LDPVAAPPDPRLGQLDRILTVRAAAPVDGREAAAVATIGRLLPGLARPFDEEADPTHVTASAIVLGQAGVVLHRHKRLGLWLQPGGHLAPGEDLAAGAVRETREETGLVPAHPPGGPLAVHVDVHAGGRGHTHLDVRWLLWADGPPHPPAGESQLVAWFGWDEALALADDGLAGALRALRSFLGV
jgi:8-oxo-dGTP pyrophosphatase MutT (NUDIX family)